MCLGPRVCEESNRPAESLHVGRATLETGEAVDICGHKIPGRLSGGKSGIKMMS